MSKTNFLIRKVINDLSQELEGDVIAHKHELKVKVPKKTKQIFADEHMIRMALENLLTNAIKYTPDGGKIEVKLTYQKNSIKVMVKDNGIGIADEQKQLIFKQFERIKNEQITNVEGTGIGLFLAQNLVALHEGTIEVKSQLETGSTFTINLPIKKPQ
jgi:signal transduction histidine kinase